MRGCGHILMTPATRIPRLAATALLVLAAASAAAHAACRLVKVGDIPVTLRGVPVAPVSLDGHPAQLIVDTGAYSSLLWRAAVAAFNIRRLGLSGGRVAGAGGTDQTELVSVRDFALADYAVHDLRFLASEVALLAFIFVVSRYVLPLVDRLDREGGAIARGGGDLGRDDALFRPRVGGGKLDPEPGLELRLLGPDGADLRPGVARNHRFPVWAIGAARPLGVDDPRGEDAGVFRPVDGDAGDRDPGRHLHRREQRVEPAEALAEDRHADHRQVGLRGGDARQRGAHPGPGDDHLQPARPRGRAELVHFVRIAMGAHHVHF